MEAAAALTGFFHGIQWFAECGDTGKQGGPKDLTIFFSGRSAGDRGTAMKEEKALRRGKADGEEKSKGRKDNIHHGIRDGKLWIFLNLQNFRVWYRYTA